MLISFSELLGRSWRFGTSHWKSLLPYSAWLFLPNIVLALCGYLAVILTGFNEAMNAIIFVLIAVLVVLNAALGVWVSLSLTYATGHGLASGVVPQWKESFTNTSQLIFPTIFVSLVMALIFFAGVIAFLIPAIVFTGWYLFVVYEIIFDNQRGLGALKASKRLVAGRWWQSVARFFVPVLMYAIFSFFIEGILLFLVPAPESLFYQQMIRNFVQGLITSFFAPFVVASTVTLYINLKQTPQTPTSQEQNTSNQPA